MVANKYIIDKKIGKGSFGEVYKGYDKETRCPVAIKVELSKTLKARALIEGRILKKLQEFEGIPKLHYFGTEGDYNVLVLELLGPNLEDLLNYCEHQLTMKSVIMLSYQLVNNQIIKRQFQIQRMESIHNRGFIHRDIKSDNFLIGCNENINRLYMIDFGLAKRYFHPNTGEHIPVRTHKGLIGTARFASINAHLGLEQSRRDDMQALGYLMVYLAKGSLPWQKVKAKNQQQKYKKIFEIKDSLTPEALCDGLPEEFAQYINLTKRLEFEEKPDYTLYKSILLNLLTSQGIIYDQVFDWMIPKSKRKTYKRQIKRKFKTTNIDSNNNDKVIPKKQIENNDETPKQQDQHLTIEQPVQQQIQLQCKPIQDNKQQVKVMVDSSDLKIEQDQQQPLCNQPLNVINQISSSDIIKKVAEVQDCDVSSSQKPQNTTLVEEEKQMEQFSNSNDKILVQIAQQQVNQHIMQKIYMKSDHMNPVNQKLLEVIQERYDEITPYERSEILNRLGQHTHSDLQVNSVLKDRFQTGRRKQTDQKLGLDFEAKMIHRRMRRALSYENIKLSDSHQLQGSSISCEEDVIADEDTQEHNVAYQFNVKLYNPLQLDKQMSPSPVKSRALSGSDSIVKLKNWNFKKQQIGSQHYQIFDTDNIRNRRQQRNSFDVIRKLKSKNQDSSMCTEYENSNFGANQINDIDSSNGTPVNCKSHLENNVQQNSPYEGYNQLGSTQKIVIQNVQVQESNENSEQLSNNDDEYSVTYSADDASHNLEEKNKQCLIF